MLLQDAKSLIGLFTEYRKWVSEGHKKKAKGKEIIDFDSLFETKQ